MIERLGQRNTHCIGRFSAVTGHVLKKNFFQRLCLPCQLHRADIGGSTADGMYGPALGNGIADRFQPSILPSGKMANEKTQRMPPELGPIKHARYRTSDIKAFQFPRYLHSGNRIVTR